MKLIIVSGLSGAGKTIVLHSLEDAGAYCIDNLPINLLPALVGQLQHLASYPWVAIGVDARNIDLDSMPNLFQLLKAENREYEIIFLQASDETLLRRFSETRRKHPLSKDHLSLSEAIQFDRKILSQLEQHATLRIDTSELNVHELRDLIRQRLEVQETQSMAILLQSFGFKHGMPKDTDFMFDMRCLPNPYWDQHLRQFTGCDTPVIEYLSTQPEVIMMLENLSQFMTTWIPKFATNNRSYLNISIGCTGGRHRSVYMVEALAEHLKQQHNNILLRHRELT
jgi:UPF0042 nucleotide-binding protein